MRIDPGGSGVRSRPRAPQRGQTMISFLTEEGRRALAQGDVAQARTAVELLVDWFGQVRRRGVRVDPSIVERAARLADSVAAQSGDLRALGASRRLRRDARHDASGQR